VKSGAYEDLERAEQSAAALGAGDAWAGETVWNGDGSTDGAAVPNGAVTADGSAVPSAKT
jgi:hypothetical protein